MLPLFDDPSLSPLSEPSPPENSPAPDLDPELHQELLRWRPSPQTIQAEIAFLGPYVEKFGFPRDQQRLKTLEHYLAKV